MRRQLWRNVAAFALMMVGVLALFVSCKEWVNPHREPAAGEVAELLKVQERTATAAAQTRRSFSLPETSRVAVGGGHRTEISVNMAPRPDHPAETDVLLREIEMFERANPDVKVHVSMWQYSPEDFLDRARNRTLPDVVQVSVSQMPAIVDMGYAADLSDEILFYPDYLQLAPEAAQLCVFNGRIYGVPHELHTLGIFYNRKMFAQHHAQTKAAEARATEAAKPKDTPKPTATPSRNRNTNTSRTPRGGGGDGTASYEIAQLSLPWRRTPQEGSAVRRGAAPTPVPTPKRGLIRRIFGLGQQEEDVQEEMQPARPTNPNDPNLMPDYLSTVSDLESAVPLFDEVQTSVGTTLVVDSGRAISAMDRRDKLTSVTEPYALPKTWDEFARTAAQMTDHAVPRYGYAPVCIAYEGGREVSQWAVQSGAERLEYKEGEKLSSELSSPHSVAALQWMRDLTGKLDVSPPLDKCYGGNVLRMFAQGQVAMVMLPVVRESFEKLQRGGMPFEDVGVMRIPAGSHGGKQLAGGTCMIVNTQISAAKRKAALRWMMFLHDPQRIALSARLLSNERELVGAPRVPIYVAERQQQVDNAIAPYRTIAQFPEYELGLCSELAAQPAWFEKAFYSTVGHDLYRFLLNPQTDIQTAALGLGRDFRSSSLATVATSEERLKTQIKDFLESAEREIRTVRDKAGSTLQAE